MKTLTCDVLKLFFEIIELFNFSHIFKFFEQYNYRNVCLEKSLEVMKTFYLQFKFLYKLNEIRGLFWEIDKSLFFQFPNGTYHYIDKYIEMFKKCA